MSTFVRKRLRSELSPARTPDTGFTNRLTGSALQAAKAAGLEFELCIFDLPDSTGAKQLFDVNNIASITVQITDTAGTVKATKTVTRTSSSAGVINPACDLAQWEAGTAQHVLVIFSGSDMNFAAGSYKVQVYGATDDATLDNDAFGIADLTVVDMFLNAGAATATAGKTVVYAEDLAGLLALFAKKVMAPGETLTFTDRDGAGNPIKRTLGLTWDSAMGAQKYDNLEQ
jgi:hypothetical protein